MNILLTGATGFIGTNFVLELYKKYNIIALVRKTSDVSEISKYCKIAYFSDDKDLDDVFEKNNIDGVVHMATKWLSTHSFNDINNLVETNITFGIKLLENCKKYNVNFFINTSTFGSYCNSKEYRPASLYAATKKAFEDIISFYSLTSACIFTNLLIFNVYGEHDKSVRLFKLLENLGDKELKMSDGNQIVDYSHVYDVVNAFSLLIDLLITNPILCKNKIFSLKGKERLCLREVVEKYEEKLGKKLDIKWGARPKRELEIVKPWEGGETLPNWEQTISLDKGFTMLIGKK